MPPGTIGAVLHAERAHPAARLAQVVLPLVIHVIRVPTCRLQVTPAQAALPGAALAQPTLAVPVAIMGIPCLAEPATITLLPATQAVIQVIQLLQAAVSVEVVSLVSSSEQLSSSALSLVL